MRVGLLGPLEIQHDGHPVAVGGGRLRALLARLALDAGRPVTTGALVDAVWEDDLPADHVHALQSLVSRLRRALGDAALVAPAPGGYRLEAQTRRAGVRARPARTLELWRGPALADLREYRFADAGRRAAGGAARRGADRARRPAGAGGAARRASAARAARGAADRRAVRRRPPGRRARRLRAHAPAARRRARRRALARAPAGAPGGAAGRAGAPRSARTCPRR